MPEIYRQNRRHKKLINKGFSLLELAVVIGVIGLIIGSVLVGQDMARSSQVKKFIKNVGEYESAVLEFQERYSALPGDMENATDFWGEADPTPATCQTTESIGKETCNGDGDGIIAQIFNVAETYETYRAWQHLANAGLLEGHYNGVNDTPTAPTRTGSTLRIQWYGDQDGSWPGLFVGVYNHVLSSLDGNSFKFPLNASEMRYIEAKKDDGFPATGDIVTHVSGTVLHCAKTADGSGLAENTDMDAIYPAEQTSCHYIQRNFIPR